MPPAAAMAAWVAGLLAAKLHSAVAASSCTPSSPLPSSRTKGRKAPAAAMATSGSLAARLPRALAAWPCSCAPLVTSLLMCCRICAATRIRVRSIRGCDITHWLLAQASWQSRWAVPGPVPCPPDSPQGAASATWATTGAVSTGCSWGRSGLARRSRVPARGAHGAQRPASSASPSRGRPCERSKLVE